MSIEIFALLGKNIEYPLMFCCLQQAMQGWRSLKINSQSVNKCIINGIKSQNIHSDISNAIFWMLLEHRRRMDLQESYMGTF